MHPGIEYTHEKTLSKILAKRNAGKNVCEMYKRPLSICQIQVSDQCKHSTVGPSTPGPCSISLCIRPNLDITPIYNKHKVYILKVITLTSVNKILLWWCSVSTLNLQIMIRDNREVLVANASRTQNTQEMFLLEPWPKWASAL